MTGGVTFCLLWTVGFSGKRFFTADEDVIRSALKQAMDFLCLEAKKQDAQLTAISSLARGGDVLFAETVRGPNACGLNVQWKCLLPFHWDAFISRDLASDAQGQPLLAGERQARFERAEACRHASVPNAEVTSPAIDPSDDQQREEAYLDCGYRTVDEADVLIFLLRQQEIAALVAGKEVAPNQPGTFSVARYALAARRPMLVLPVDAADPWEERTILNDPAATTPPSPWFVDPMITEVVRRAKELGLPARLRPLPPGISDRGKSVWQMQQSLGHLADKCQSATLVGLRRILRFHLAASALAALMATVFAFEEVPALVWFLIPLVLLAFMKPLLAFGAWILERRLHHRGDRQDWVHARVLAELCRGALATWPLPIQPLDANDEEDFPKVKRLIRTLRLLREQDCAAATHGTPTLPRETQLEADMRVASQNYVHQRLLEQANDYYGPRHFRAQRQATSWRVGFIIATWTAISVGLALALDKTIWASGNHFLPVAVEHWMEAVVIIAPFVAAHCLGMMTILDCRRRENRYEEMRHYLTRLADTLAKTQANPSRIRIIEHAERMMIEEQHEWFSVMRNLSV